MKFFPAVAALPLMALMLTGCSSANAGFGTDSAPSFQPTTDSAPADWMDPKECVTLFDGDITPSDEEPEEVTLDCDATEASFKVDSDPSGPNSEAEPIRAQDVYAQLPGGPGDWHIKDYVSNMQNGKRVYHISYGDSGLNADGTAKSPMNDDREAVDGEMGAESNFCVATSTEGEDSTRVYCSLSDDEETQPTVVNTLDDDGKVVSKAPKPKKTSDVKAESEVAPQSGPVLSY